MIQLPRLKPCSSFVMANNDVATIDTSMLGRKTARDNLLVELSSVGLMS